MSTRVAIAIGAHPDDIEFYMAGTLLQLKAAGYRTHYLTVASGSCGSNDWGAARTREVRRREARSAAAVLGAEFHPSLTDDLEIFYDLPLLRRVAAVIRDVQPGIVLTHSPEDYMEDHSNTCRLSVTAAFARGMPNFRTRPSRGAITGDVAVYHCMPHGLRDPLRRRAVPGIFVNTTSVQDLKLAALSRHRSQQKWLDASQGLNSYLHTMNEFSLQMGRMSKRFKHAEGWRRHLHLGFSTSEIDPLADVLGKRYWLNRVYERSLQL